MNNEAIDQGLSAIVKVDVPAAWADAVDEPVDMSKHTKFFREFSIPVNALEGDDLPVSAYDGIEDGRWPTGTCAEENAASPCSYRAGMLKNVSAVTSVPSSAPMLLSVRS